MGIDLHSLKLILKSMTASFSAWPFISSDRWF